MARSNVVSAPKYELTVDLRPFENAFEVRSKLTFQLAKKKLTQPLFLDFEGGVVRELRINGVTMKTPNGGQPLSRSQGRTFLATEALRNGVNTVETVTLSMFSLTGQGLNRFRDPVDGEYYVWSDHQPFAVHTVFPCFDQSDLKATFQLRVKAPPHWHVVSNNIGKREKNETVFPALGVAIPPYAFALMGGPFEIVEGPPGRKVPLRLLLRKTLRPFVEAESWLRAARFGIEAMETLTRTPFPFRKLDLILVPGLLSQAMENVGAITFSERFVGPEAETTIDRSRRIETEMHEIAHMWFGNLVSPRWWDDLWVTEGFATLMGLEAYHELEKHFRILPMDQALFTLYVKDALIEDAEKGARPIRRSVGSTDEAETGFDGVIYGKSAAALWELQRLQGRPAFLENVSKWITASRKRRPFRRLSEDLASSFQLALYPDMKSWLDQAGNFTELLKLSNGPTPLSAQWSWILRMQAEQAKGGTVASTILRIFDLLEKESEPAMVIAMMDDIVALFEHLETKSKPALQEKFEALLARHAMSTIGDEELRSVWRMKFLELAETADSLTMIRELFPNLHSIQERWMAIETFAKTATPESRREALEQIAQHARKTPAVFAARFKTRAELRLADREEKKTWLERFHRYSRGSDPLELNGLRDAMELFQGTNSELTDFSVEPYFDFLAGDQSDRDGTFLLEYTRGLYPKSRSTDPFVVKSTKALLAKPALRPEIRVELEKLER